MKLNPVASVLQISGKGNSLTADIRTEEPGWPWLEAEFSGGGRLIVCGFRIIEVWPGTAARALASDGRCDVKWLSLNLVTNDLPSLLRS